MVMPSHLLRSTLTLALTAAALGSGLTSRAGATPAAVTFTRDIAPILFRQCASCHRPDGSAPFSVLSFADVRPRARAIASAVQRRTMPPWKPAAGHGDFVGVRRLDDDEIAAIVRWAEDGAPQGDSAAMPPAPGRAGEWQLGQPDLIVAMPAPYRLPPGGPDRLRNFVLPVPIQLRRYVRAWEFRISNERVVHHATLLIDRTPASRELDEKDPEPGYEGLIALSAKNPDGFFVGWTPGQRPSTAPDDSAWPVDPQSCLVAMLHLRPTDRWETVDVRIGLHFAAAPPTRPSAMIRMNRQDIDIPPGERRYVISDSYVLPVDVDAYGVQPHAHNLARQVKAWAILPDGTVEWLIDIPSWDFHWQDSYRFVQPLRLPARTRLSMEYTYDNSPDNPANPGRAAPRRVLWGQRTSDEMGDLWIQVLPARPADLDVLNQSLRDKLLPQDISGYQSMLKADPDNVSLHDDLALLFSAAGEWHATVAQFAQSLRLRPDAASHYNLGNALLRTGDLAEADVHFEHALQLKPDYALAHQGLALSLTRQGKRPAVIGHLRTAVRLMPGMEDGHYNLGVLLAAEHQPAAAIASLRRALEIRGDWPAAQAELAWVLATSPDPSVRDGQAAVSLAGRAVQLTLGRDARALDVLAASLAAVGRFDDAVDAATKALSVAEPSLARTTADGIRRRLGLYRKRIAYIEPTATPN
jgi:tetratricopeptide (TPR) repeat protein/mono/diheme cytochrome c family protein